MGVLNGQLHTPGYASMWLKFRKPWSESQALNQREGAAPETSLAAGCMNGPLRDRALWAVAAMAFAYLAVFTALTAYRFSLIGACYDLSVFEQSFWSLVNKGELLVNSQEGVEVGRFSHFSLHVSPLLLLVAPLYALWQAPQTLLFAKTLALALAAFPIYGLAARLLGSKGAGVAVAAIYLMYPPLHGVNLWGFHENEFAVAPLAFMLFFHETKRRRLFWAAAIAALCAKETIALTVGAFGLYLLLFRKERLRGAALVAMAALWFVACEQIVMPLFRGDQPMAGENVYIAMRYDPRLGTTYGEIAWTCLRHPLRVAAYALGEPLKRAYLFKLFFPLAFLPLLAPETLLICAPVLAQNLLARYKGQFVILGQYHAELIPFLFYGLCLGIGRASRLAQLSRGFAENHEDPHAESHNHRAPLTNDHSPVLPQPLGSMFIRRSLIGAALAAALAANAAFELWPFAVGRTGQFQASVLPPQRREAARELLAMIPPEASVLADWDLISHLGARPWLHLIQQQALEARPWDYIIYDSQFPWLSDFTQADFYRFLDSSDYQLVARKDGFFLFKKPQTPPPPPSDRAQGQ